MASYTAKQVFAIIDAMEPAERKKLLGMMDDTAFGKKTGCVVVPMGLLDGLVKYSKLDQESRKILIDENKKAYTLLGKYNEGPKARFTKTSARRNLIKSFMDAGIKEPRRIKQALNRDYGIEVELKTIQNDISIIRKTQQQVP
jgi:hypothetical protein